MSWLNKITTRDGKLAPASNGNGKSSSKSGSRSVTPSPSLPKISLPPSDAQTPKLVLTHDDDSPHTVSPNSVHRADSMTPSMENLGRPMDAGSHKRYATIADEMPSRPREGSNAGTVTPSKPSSRSRSNSQSESGPSTNFPLTESPTQSVGSRRSGSITSGDSNHYQSIQQLVDPMPVPPIPDPRPRVKSTSGVSDKNRDATTSPGKKRHNSRQHASSVGASSPLPRFGKPPTRHQTTMGMGLASALVASGMGIAPPPSMLSSPTGGLAPPTLAKKPSNVSATNIRQASPERTRVVRPRPTRSSSGNSKPHDDSGSESDDYDSGDALSFNDDEIPITGFAVATMKRNQDFHELFPQVPSDDYLIDDYGCALQRDILIQGRLYISENHICFHANIFGWVTDLIIPVNGIVAVDKRTTAFVIPNAIGVVEQNGTKYTFASFLARDTAYDVIHSVWRNAGTSRSAADSPGSDVTPGRENGFPNVLAEVGGARARKATQCACSKAGAHYPSTAMEMIVPGTPEQIYNLMFASGFIKDFLAKDQKLIDIQTSDWQPSPENQHLLSRNMSYIKPLSGGFGPKQTKCELRDENQHVDYNDYASTITTTRTPDVPSGSVFSVKTRTCITWAGSSTTKVVVTFTVEWTGKSFIKGIIERSCNDGQKTYYSELETAMRKYIVEHRTEFLPEGVDADAADEEAAVEEAALNPLTPKDGGGLQPTGPKPVATSRGLQWGLDTTEAAWKVASDSISGLFDILSDISGNISLSGTTILAVIIVLLVISNVYTILTMGERRETGRRQAKEKRETERERWVGDAVKAFMQVQSLNGGIFTPPASPTAQSHLAPAVADTKAELEELRRVAALLEERLTTIKSRLDQLD